MRQRSWIYLIGLNAPAFSIVMLHIITNPYLYHFMLMNFIEHGRLAENRINTAMSLLGITGLLVAGVAQPFWGYLSDKTHTPFGSRYPYLLGGALMTILTLLLFIQAFSWWMLLIGVIAIQFFVNAVQSPLQALIPDHVQPNQMGVAASIKTVLELLGIIMSGVVVWLFLGDRTHSELAVLSAGGVLLACIFIAIRVAPPGQEKQPRRVVTAADRYIRRYSAAAGRPIWIHVRLFQTTALRLISNRSILWWIASRFLFYASFNALGKLSINYITDVYQYEGGEARSIQAAVSVASGIAIFLVTIPAGILADRFDRRRIAAVGGLIAATAAALLITVPQIVMAAIIFGVLGVGSGIFLSVGWALITHIVPSREAAFYLGFANIATTLGGAFGLLSGPLIDQVNSITGQQTPGYQVLFAITAVFFLCGALSVMQIEEPESE